VLLLLPDVVMDATMFSNMPTFRYKPNRNAPIRERMHKNVEKICSFVTKRVPRTWYCSSASETWANGLLMPPVELPNPELADDGREGELVLLLAPDDDDDALRGRDAEKS
jgi:hypothetical protein